MRTRGSMRKRAVHLPQMTRGRVSSSMVISRARIDVKCEAHPAFRNNVSGEWEGRLVNYDAQGNALELPHHLVPDAYREWDMVPTSWQTQCSMRVVEDRVEWVNRKLIPTVGCEADAVAFEEDGCKDNAAPVPVHCLENGSFCIAPRDISTNSKWQVHHCLVNLPKEERLRIVQKFINLPDGSIVLQDVEVVLERFEEEYNGKPLLNGCGGPCVTEFGDKPAPKEDWFENVWVPVRDCSTHFGKDVEDIGVLESSRELESADGLKDQPARLLLPSSMWVSARGNLNSSSAVEVGWFADDQLRLVSSLSFSGGTIISGFLGRQRKGH